jgi:hypothetical protein
MVLALLEMGKVILGEGWRSLLVDDGARAYRA